MDTSLQHSPARRPLYYDAVRRRLWIGGQRCHHGATGALLALVAGLGLGASTLRPRRGVALLATGSLLMAHDWHDRPLWFERGWQAQP
jgi:hypothetical protein